MYFKKEPRIFYIPFPFLFGKFRAITLPPFGIFIEKSCKNSKNLRLHELCHWAQFEETRKNNPEQIDAEDKDKSDDELKAEYAEIADLAEHFHEILESSQVLRESGLPEDVRKEFPGSMYEALLRRSKDLLVSAHTLEVQKAETDLTIEDLKHALHGLRTFLEIMRDLETRELHKFEVVDQTDQLYKFAATNKENGAEYGLKVFVRPEEEKRGQARINFELNFDTKNPNEELKKAFSQETDFKEKKKTLFA